MGVHAPGSDGVNPSREARNAVSASPGSSSTSTHACSPANPDYGDNGDSFGVDPESETRLKGLHGLREGKHVGHVSKVLFH